jgi:hypothetical protein
MKIRYWPVIRSLEWKGLKYVFGGDTYPNKAGLALINWTALVS